jgi:hypothetical protein
MKNFLLAILLFSLPTFGQVRTFVDSLTTSDTTSHFVARGYEYAVLTITLSSANDTVLVYTGTTEASPKYGRIGVIDALTDANVTLITGNTSVNRKYFLKNGYKQKYLRLESTSNGATVKYTLEAH